ncbi:MAG: T9SS type A sorting domain-containing protein [Sphingobacteriales bacterium]|nr:T9SS type A sorting domain-containing protein [Sphingobacteriales bacterium]
MKLSPIRKKILFSSLWMLCGLLCYFPKSSNAQSFNLGWEGTELISRSVFIDTQNWNAGFANGDHLSVTTDSNTIHLHWQFGSGNRDKWVVYYLKLNTPITISDSDIIGVDVKGSVGHPNRNFSLKFEDGVQQAVFTSHGLASLNRWVNRISTPKKQFAGNPDWNNIKVITFAVFSDASSNDLQPDSGTVSIRNLKIADINHWQRASGFERLKASNFLDSVKLQALDGIIKRQAANGLLYSWKEDNASWLYGQGLALKLLSLEGLWENKLPVNDAARAAEKLARFLAGQQTQAGYWPRGWNTLEGTVRSVDEVLWMGDFPWMITGLASYYAKSGDDTVIPSLKKAQSFLYDLIEPSGKFYTLNTATGEKIPVTNTEAYTAAINSVYELGDTVKANTMLHYISSSTWDNNLLYWKEAIDLPRPTLFSNTWMTMLSHHSNDSTQAINSLSFVGKVLATHGPGFPEGFDGIGPIATWYEGTLTYICAGGPNSQTLFDSLMRYRFPDGTMPSYNDNIGAKADIWAVNWSSLDATSWLYFAAAKRSPFVQYNSFHFPPITTGVNQTPIAEYISIYPVPAKEIINISFHKNAGKIREIAIYNLLGKCLIRKSNLSADTKMLVMDISTLASGTYIFSVKVKNQNLYQKIQVIK